jgi:hypothetical protein
LAETKSKTRPLAARRQMVSKSFDEKHDNDSEDKKNEDIHDQKSSSITPASVREVEIAIAQSTAKFDETLSNAVIQKDSSLTKIILKPQSSNIVPLQASHILRVFRILVALFFALLAGFLLVYYTYICRFLILAIIKI